MRKTTSRLAVCLLAVCLCAGISQAIPRYSMQFNQTCGQCHINPDGHGTRNLFGASYYAYNELAMAKPSPDQAGKVNPMISDQVQIGTDSRLLYFGQINKKGQSGTNSFMQMQGELYLIYNFSPMWLLYLDKGLGAGPSGAGSFQIFGLGRFKPLNSFIKAGHFAPPYGMYLPDHKAFVRDKLGFGMFWRESGVELGINPGSFLVSVAGTNGNTNFVDTDEGKAVTGHAEFRHNFQNLHLWIGASGRYNQAPGLKDRFGGGYGGLALHKLVLIGEVDYHDQESSGQRTKSLASFAELSLRVHRGITVRGEYDFYDPDVKHKTGSQNMYVGGLEIIPYGFLEVIPNARYHHDTAPGSTVNYWELEVQLHLFY